MTRASSAERALAALFVVGAIVANFAAMGRAVVGLNIGLLVCFALWMAAPWGPCSPRLRGAVAVAIAIQILHVVEEHAAGFYRAFPARFGYEWSAPRFVVFNVAWLLLFVLALVGLRSGARLSYLVVLFLAVVGGVGNGIVHVALATQAGGYFPGLFTAPLCFAAGAVVVVLLPRATSTGGG
ncbi:MAG: HXXEE domain-containing protein [Candidatus Binatia bacterium]